MSSAAVVVQMFSEPRPVVVQQRARGGRLPKSVASLSDLRRARQRKASGLEEGRQRQIAKLRCSLAYNEERASEFLDASRRSVFELAHDARQRALKWRAQYLEYADEDRRELQSLGAPLGAAFPHTAAARAIDTEGGAA